MTQLRTGLRWSLGLLVAVGLLGTAGDARAQEVRPVDGAGGEPSPPAPEPRTFGTSATTSHTLPAFAFTGATAADIASFGLFGVASRFCNATCVLEAPLVLPAGARVTSVELDGCDASVPGSFTLALFRSGKFESGAAALTATLFTGSPGCTAFTANLTTPHTIDNANNLYFVQVSLTGGTSAIRFQAVRVFYTLQVSPAPAVATFADVSASHPFFRFIEALVASGITAGCGGGNFCPDAPLTRGQMAVFLSLGLGLHFAP
jgi:S-layer homology domain